jgi:hypothetical protein
VAYRRRATGLEEEKCTLRTQKKRRLTIGTYPFASSQQWNVWLRLDPPYRGAPRRPRVTRDNGREVPLQSRNACLWFTDIKDEASAVGGHPCGGTMPR